MHDGSLAGSEIEPGSIGQESDAANQATTAPETWIANGGHGSKENKFVSTQEKVKNFNYRRQLAHANFNYIKLQS
jgi:hypothetical protein